MNITFEDMKLSDLENITLKNFDDFWNDNILRNDFFSPTSYYIVAKIQNNIIGFAGINQVLEEAHIANIAVKVDKRNLGIRFKTFRKTNKIC